MTLGLSAFLQAVMDGDTDLVSRLLTAHPGLATARLATGAPGDDTTEQFYEGIRHQCYRGDTALHLAAAAFRASMVGRLVDAGAAIDAKNRRHAEPLHYAADANRWDPAAQAETIAYLLSAGANPNVHDANGATPLHRAVRTRSAAAVHALLTGGADVHVINAHGSTPLDLATRTTGRGGTGSAHARAQQAEILAALRAAGAQPGTATPAARRR